MSHTPIISYYFRREPKVEELDLTILMIYMSS